MRPGTPSAVRTDEFRRAHHPCRPAKLGLLCQTGALPLSHVPTGCPTLNHVDFSISRNSTRIIQPDRQTLGLHQRNLHCDSNSCLSSIRLSVATCKTDSNYIYSKQSFTFLYLSMRNPPMSAAPESADAIASCFALPESRQLFEESVHLSSRTAWQTSVP